MNTKMTVLITIKGKIDSRDLYSKLARYGANVTDMIDKTFVFVTIDLRDDAIEHIIRICSEYGECNLEAHMAKESEGKVE